MKPILLTTALLLAASAQAAPRIFRPPLWIGHQIARTGSDLAHPGRDWFWSTTQYALILAYGADMSSSDYVASRCNLCTEAGPFFRGTHRMWNVSLAWAALDGSAIVASDWIEHTKAAPLSAATAWLTVGHMQAAYSNAGICSKSGICR
jgi:hypothetical protein